MDIDKQFIKRIHLPFFFSRKITTLTTLTSIIMEYVVKLRYITITMSNTGTQRPHLRIMCKVMSGLSFY